MKPCDLRPEDWPTTVQATVKDVIGRMSEDEKRTLRKMPKGHLLDLHFELGLYIRNSYGLLRGNDRLLHAACGRSYLRDPDDASMHIIEALWDALQE